MSAATASKSKKTSAPERTTSQIVNKHVLYSMGVGAVPIPFVDVAGITAIQLSMINKLANYHNDTFSKKAATSIISSLVASVGAKGAATGAIGSLIKMIPVVGTVAGAVTFPAVAGATTFALGQVFIRHYESGGTLLSFNTESAKEFFQDQYSKGKEKVSKMKNAATGKKSSESETK